ncbi:DNA polymerase III subunit delta' C-terminal domain-containing protein [unidentified bacterial endosymbiont]|uniref:DNA polymerase III subunit delta' C-terminal domain-containing protein n=1 Tax=unidentified bacterial endosymbiont TaxID=2355 RepID=UPI0020A159B5|nr:DNA polymerase III subunit delta' C-terminal domain-containing protein [unidentified bacterial endosymbiont]
MLDYPWLTPLYDHLVQQHQQARGHHAQLIMTPPGCGSERLLARVAQWLLCQQRQAEQPCSHCHACTLMAVHHHPDYHLIRLESGKQQLTIEQIRTVLPSIYQRAQQGGAKVIGLLDSERLSESAANALLKALEEPPPATYFLLVCRTGATLPITLRSRCQHWSLDTPALPEAIAWLQSQDPTVMASQATTALHLSLGAPLAALALLKAGGLQQYTALLQDLQRALQQRDLLLVLPHLDHNNVHSALYWLATVWLAALKQQWQVADVRQACEQRQLLSTLATTFTPEQLQACCQRTLRCRHTLLILPSVNQTLLLTELLCRQQEVLYSPYHRQ